MQIEDRFAFLHERDAREDARDARGTGRIGDRFAPVHARAARATFFFASGFEFIVDSHF